MLLRAARLAAAVGRGAVSLLAVRLLGIRIGLRRRGVGAAHAVALHLFCAQLLDDGCAHHLGDYVELAMLEAFVNDEAHERLAVHRQPV